MRATLSVLALLAVVSAMPQRMPVDMSDDPACTEAGYRCAHVGCIDHATGKRCDPAKPTVKDTMPNKENAYFWVHGDEIMFGDVKPEDILKDHLFNGDCIYNQCAHADQDGAERCIKVKRWKDDPNSAYDWDACVKVNDMTNKAEAGDDATVLWKQATEAIIGMVHELIMVHQTDTMHYEPPYGTEVWTPNFQYSVPRQIDYRQYTKWGSALTISLSFRSAHNVAGCEVMNKVRYVTDNIATVASKIPGVGTGGGLLLIGAGIPLRIASFMNGCEAIKPSDWPEEMVPKN